MTLEELVRIYLQKAVSKGHTEATRENKTNLFNRIMLWLDGREFNLDSAEDYIAYLRIKPNPRLKKVGYSNESIRTEVANIKALIRFAWKRKYITENWAEELEKPRKKRPLWEPPKRDKVIEAIIEGTEPQPFIFGVSGDNSKNRKIKEDTRLMLLFELDTGLRPNELKRLKGSDLMLDIATPKFRIPPSKGHEDELGIVPPQLIPELQKRVNNERLFKATAATGNDALQRGFAKIGVKLPFNPTMHKLRHFFASYLITNGINIDVVKKLMRHNDISTTIENYIHYYDSDLIDAVYKTIPEARATLPIVERLKYYEEVFNRLGIRKDEGLDYKIHRGKKELMIRISAV